MHKYFRMRSMTPPRDACGGQAVIRYCLASFPALLATLLVLGCLSCTARGDAFDDAARSYEKGQGPESVAGFEKLIQTHGASFELLYNLGNAHFRNGSPGKALNAWRRAEYLRPRDADLQSNISLVGRQANATESTELVRIGRRIRVQEAAWAALALNLIWAGLLATGAWRADLHHRLGLVRWLAGAASLVWFAGYAGVWWCHHEAPDLVVVAADAAVRSGPLEEAPIAFSTPEGLELKTIDARNDWLNVTDSNGRQGWIIKTQIERHSR